MFVYKVMGNFSNENFGEILNKIQDRFKFIYRNNTLYLSIVDYNKNKDIDVKSMLKQVFTPEDFLVSEVTEKNIMKEEDIAREWCRDCLVNIDEQKYEYEKQQKLRDVMKAMDYMEEILDKQYKEMYKVKDGKNVNDIKRINTKRNNAKRKEEC